MKHKRRHFGLSNFSFQGSFQILLNMLTGVLVTIAFQSCNTLYNSHIFEIEIMEPGKIVFPAHYKTLAVRNNNANEGYNRILARYFLNKKSISDSRNLDSIASKKYFNQLVGTLQNQILFDSVICVTPGNFSHIRVIDTISTPLDSSAFTPADYCRSDFSICLQSFYPKHQPLKDSLRYLHPRLNLYHPRELNEIADTTRADLLLSLDHFHTRNSITRTNKSEFQNATVEISAFWTAYDLNKREISFHLYKVDTIEWNILSSYAINNNQHLPSREEALLIAAEAAGEGFAHYLCPSYTTVRRMYYRSGHVIMRMAQPFVEQNRWLDAAKIWKSQLNNPNKNIVAKCKFNLAVACEMEGDLDAALEWVVDSYHTLGNKNEVHADNCVQYIQILGRRKLDLRQLELQFQGR